MAKRHVTYFGVALPPWKEKKIGAGSTSIRFVLKGNIISKKNNEQAVAVRRFAKQHLYSQQKGGMVTLSDALKAVDMVHAKIRGNAAYLEFVERMKPVLQEQMDVWVDRLGSKGLVFPLNKASLNIRLYIKDRYRRDIVNAQQTIQDLLKDCKVIEDDNDKIINPIFSESANYYDEILYNIAFVSLSFRLSQ